MKKFYSFENEQGDFSICYGENEEDSESMVVCAVDDWHKETVIMLNSIVEKLRIEYDAEFEAFKKSFEDGIHQMSENYNELAGEKNKAYELLAQCALRRNAAEMRIDHLSHKLMKLQLRCPDQIDDDPNDGKNSSHIHSGGKGGWSV